ncbi:MAG: BTAD domain-containing putative transcriptional regulator [Solirubrobacteraceae bacterium]
MEFRVLGDLEVRHDGVAIPLGAHQQRAVLAILVLHAGEVVSADRLMDELWGDEPPARAAKTVQVYVSRLRKALSTAGATSADLIVTRDHGYVLQVDPAQVDVRVFERLLDEGRQAHAECAFERAADVLAEGLALWRGPPLADFTFDPFAAREIARLKERHLEALELRIGADLELGRHGALVAELETLTAEHPLRERLRGQRMLALYRSGRQSEALELYAETRRLLVDELGIEPSAELRELHQAMLGQDPALRLAPAPRLPVEGIASGVAARRRRRLTLGLVAAALVAGLTAVIALTHRGAAEVSVGANSVAIIDPAHDAVVGQVSVGVRPSDISSGAGGVWVANLNDDSVSKIDPTREKVVGTYTTGTSVDGLTTAGGALWTMDVPDATVLRIDPTFTNVVKRIRVGKPLGGSNTIPSPIAAGSGSVWASNGFAEVARIPTGSGDIKETPDVGNEPAAIADGASATWVADDLDNSVSRIGRVGVVTSTIPVGDDPSAIAVGAGAVWVANTGNADVTRIDPATSSTQTTIDVGAGPTGVAVGLGAVWVANSLDGSVSRIDPRTNHVIDTIKVGGSPDRIAVAAGRVWVTVQAGSSPPPAVAGGTVRIVQHKDFNSTDPALMVSYGPQAAQLEYATCAKLLDYPDRPGPQGSQLVPEVAAAMPTVSADGRTYTFTVRPGFRFSPPSNQPVTAQAFQRALERFLSPVMQPQDDLAALMANIAGYGAYRSHKASRLAGVAATGRTLTIRLAHRDPSLPARIAMPYFCAVPPDTPIRAKGIDFIPSAGPYYIAAHNPNRDLVLRRNPNYHGSRPRRPAQIDYRFGVTAQQGAALVESGHADYANAAIGDQHFASSLSPDVKARLDRLYGQHSPAARAGRQQYFINRTLALQYLLLNSRRPLFASTRMRQAVNLAIDRSALAKTAGPDYSGLPTDQYLPTGMPGFRDADIYPLGRPNAARARRLAGPRHRHAVMYTCNLPACLNLAAIVRSNLGAIGIDVEVKSFSIFPMFRREFTKGEPFDIGWYGYSVDYPDPSDFIDLPFTGSDAAFPGTGAERYAPRIAAASRLARQQRLHAYGQLDIDLARHAAPAVAFANLTAEDFFSATTGCQVFQPIYGMDLGALCRRGQP